MRKYLIALSLILIIVLGSYWTRWGTSAVRPQETSSDFSFPDNINKIFQKSCIDCHSPYTKIPLYGHIFPVTLYLQDHVEEAMDELDLSKWDDYSLKRQLKKAEEIYEEVEEAEMPPTSYTILHPNSKLSPDEIDEIKIWYKNFISTNEQK